MTRVFVTISGDDVPGVEVRYTMDKPFASAPALQDFIGRLVAAIESVPATLDAVTPPPAPIIAPANTPVVTP